MLNKITQVAPQRAMLIKRLHNLESTLSNTKNELHLRNIKLKNNDAPNYFNVLQSSPKNLTTEKIIAKIEFRKIELQQTLEKLAEVKRKFIEGLYN